MKKATAALIGLLMLFSLYSCATVKNDLELSQDRANIESIAIYAPEHAYSERDIHCFLENNKPVALLESESHASFLDALVALKFEKEVFLFPIPMDGGCDYNGYIIAIVYSDGGYDIIAESGTYSYSFGDYGQGMHKYDHSDYCGEVAWTEFIEGYIEK